MDIKNIDKIMEEYHQEEEQLTDKTLLSAVKEVYENREK